MKVVFRVCVYILLAAEIVKTGTLADVDSRRFREEQNSFRLSGDILPSFYDIHLEPIVELGNFTTLGSIDITINCIRTTTNITINSLDIQIDEDSIQIYDVTEGASLGFTGLIDEQKTREIITIQVSSPGLRAGNQYKIHMRFISVLNNELRGFYRSTYVDQNGEVKYLAVTQMAAPDARRAFPCFDEPSMKAQFAITLSRKDSMITRSNMPLKSTSINENMPGYVWDHYETSLTMSSYLVAMMVSEFVSILSDPALSPGVEFRLWTRPGFQEQTRYAGDIGPRTLTYFSKVYLGIDYPLPKLDMVAVPDFAAGAMENWGLINYREADLLIDDERSSEVAKQRVAMVIGHELAHQWFGNLVTHEWWNVVWLKEGFARYMQYISTDYVEPTFGMDDQFVVDVMQYVFAIDGLESSRPINSPANSRDEINQNYDAISYEKGACLLRMAENLVGKETYRKGIIRYLNDNAYGNAVQDDLWAALQAQVDADGQSVPFGVKAVMDTWTSKMGYPVITVNRNYESGSAQIAQQRFLLSRTGTSGDQTDYRWHVPLTYSSNFAEPAKTGWLAVNQNATTLESLGSSSNQWVVFNVHQVGYYRVLYDGTNLDLLLDQLLRNRSVIRLTNRAQLLDDYLNLARADMVPYAQALSLTKYLVHETDYLPWAAASTALDYIDQMLFGLPDYQDWIDYMEIPMGALYQHVGFTPGPQDPHLLVYARSVAVNWACNKLGIAGCVQDARDLFSAWMKQPSENDLISPNLRLSISCTAVAYGSWDEWTFVYGQYNDSTLGNEKIDYLQAMACPRDAAIISRTLDLMIDPTSGIRTQDANRLFSSIAANPYGHPIALDFMANRWDDIENYFSGYAGFGGNGNLPGFFKALCNRANTQETLDKLEALVADHPEELAGLKSVQQGLELARSNVDWVDKFHDIVIEWVKGEKTTPATATTAKPSSAPATMFSVFGFVYVFLLLVVAH